MPNYAWRLLLPAAVMSLITAPALAANFDTQRGVPYHSVAGVELLADVYVPAGAGPHPGVVMIHGGGWRTGNREQMDSKAERLAAAGYTVVNVSYRLGPEHRWPAQVHDVKQAVRWMRQEHARLKLDRERIAAFGYSAGAHLAALLGTTRPEDGLEGSMPEGAPSSSVQAVIAGGTPADLTLFNDNRSTRALFGGDRRDYPDAYREASPVNHVSADDPPVFLYHGRHDRIVPVEQAQHLKRALDTAGVPSELHVAPFGHVYRFLFDGAQVRRAITFLDRHLRP